jgi:hypothetical protein
MSNYYSKAINPETGKLEEAVFLDDYFGKHEYGVKFSNGNLYKIKDIKIPMKELENFTNEELNKKLEDSGLNPCVESNEDREIAINILRQL